MKKNDDFEDILQTDKGYYSDSEVIKMDASKKKDALTIGFKDFEFKRFLG